MLDCSPWLKYSGYAYFIICFILSIFSMYLTYKYIKNSHGSLKKTSFCIGLLFYISSNLGLFTSTLHGFNACLFNNPFSNWRLQNKLYYFIFAFCCCSQYHVMLIVLCDRLYGVFRGTAIALSKCHKINFILLHLLFIIIMIIGVIFIKNAIIVFICQIAYILILITLIIYITGLFIKKLFQMYHAENIMPKQNKNTITISLPNKNGNLMSLIIKCVTLTCLSVGSSFLSWGLFIVFRVLDKSSFYVSFLLLFDILNNLLCITLTFSFADKQYHKYCYIFDNCFRKMSQFMISTDDETAEIIAGHLHLQMVDDTTGASEDIPTIILSDHVTTVSISDGITSDNFKNGEITPQKHHE